MGISEFDLAELVAVVLDSSYMANCIVLVEAAETAMVASDLVGLDIVVVEKRIVARVGEVHLQMAIFAVVDMVEHNLEAEGHGTAGHVASDTAEHFVNVVERLAEKEDAVEEDVAGCVFHAAGHAVEIQETQKVLCIDYLLHQQVHRVAYPVRSVVFSRRLVEVAKVPDVVVAGVRVKKVQ